MQYNGKKVTVSEKKKYFCFRETFMGITVSRVKQGLSSWNLVLNLNFMLFIFTSPWSFCTHISLENGFYSSRTTTHSSWWSFDEKVNITLRGLEPGSKVTPRSQLDEMKMKFESHANYQADKNGELSLAHSQLKRGSFTGKGHRRIARSKLESTLSDFELEMCYFRNIYSQFFLVHV